jgi:hypothetical protein
VKSYYDRYQSEDYNEVYREESIFTIDEECSCV